MAAELIDQLRLLAAHDATTDGVARVLVEMDRAIDAGSDDETALVAAIRESSLSWACCRIAYPSHPRAVIHRVKDLMHGAYLQPITATPRCGATGTIDAIWILPADYVRFAIPVLGVPASGRLCRNRACFGGGPA